MRRALPDLHELLSGARDRVKAGTSNSVIVMSSYHEVTINVG